MRILMVKISCIIAVLIAAAGCTQVKVYDDTKPAFEVNTALFNHKIADTVGLSPIESNTYTIFSPQFPQDMKFNNHPQLAIFKGMMYACWVGHPEHETSPEAYLFISRSQDGQNWEKPWIIGNPLRACGGLWATQKALYCYGLVADNELKGDNSVTDRPQTEIYKSTDGVNFELINVIDNAMPSESPRATPTGRLIMPCHGLGTGELSDVRISRLLYTDDPEGVKGWKEGKIKFSDEIQITGSKKMARPIEPSWFARKDGTLVAIFRDLRFDAKIRTWRTWSAVSRDNGKSWSEPVLTNMPDSDSMQCARNLPDGTVCMINNPVPTRRRVPLAMTLSKDGYSFNHSFLLRAAPQKKRFEGISKTDGYSYPGAIVWGDNLFVSYATNKEDIEITQITLAAISREINK